MFLLFLLTRNLLTECCLLLSHNKGQRPNSTMKSLDLLPKNADQRDLLTCLHYISADFFKVFYFIFEKFQSFSSTKSLRKAFRHLLKFLCLETCYFCCSPEHWEEEGISHIPCCSGSGEVLASGRKGSSKALYNSFW